MKILGLILLLAHAAFAVHPNITPKTWYKVPTTLSTVYQTPNYGGGPGPAAVVKYSGGAFDDNANNLLIFGGGHLDYYGNEIYCFNVDSLAYTRCKDASGYVSLGGAAELSGYYDSTSSGPLDPQSPRARHSTHYLAYATNVSRFFSAACKDPSTTAGNSSNVCNLFNFTTGLWSACPNNPVAAGELTLRAITAYSHKDGKVWHHQMAGSNARLSSYDPVANTWASPGAIGDVGPGTQSADIDTSMNRLYAIGNGNVSYFDLSSPGTAAVSVTTTGPTKCQDALAPGVQWSPVDSLFICWESTDTVYTLNPRTAVWAKITPDASNTVSPTLPADQDGFRATWGRFRFIPNRNSFVLQNATTDSVYMYRLSAVPAPNITTNPSSTSVPVGDIPEFTGAASGIPPGNPITVQWQKNGTNIGGATTTTYTAPPAVSGDDGATFRMIATNFYGVSDTSTTATLSISGGRWGVFGDNDMFLLKMGF